MVEAIGTVVRPAIVFTVFIVSMPGCSWFKAALQGDAGRVAAATGGGAGKTLPDFDLYRIGPEDKLRISVWNNEELTLDLTVRPDGKISLPLVQDIQAEGLTADELAGAIHRKLLAFIKDPNVSVIVLQVNASKFYVVGAVDKPGTYPLRGSVSVLQALSMAGGFTQFASPRNIRLVRNTGGKQKVLVINYYNAIEGREDHNCMLRPGDTLVVP